MGDSLPDDVGHCDLAPWDGPVSGTAQGSPEDPGDVTDPFSTEQGGVQATMQDYVDELVAEDYGVPAVDPAACAADTGALFGGFALEKGLMLATGSMRRQWRPQPAEPLLRSVSQGPSAGCLPKDTANSVLPVSLATAVHQFPPIVPGARP